MWGQEVLIGIVKAKFTKIVAYVKRVKNDGSVGIIYKTQYY